MRKSLSAALILGCATLCAKSAQAAPSAQIKVESGALVGSTDAGVTAFKGIPFAAPPTGALRWRPPQPAKPWTGVFDATQYGHDCMQKPFPSDAAPLGTTPAEDCLVLNVWRPAEARFTAQRLGGAEASGGKHRRITWETCVCVHRCRSACASVTHMVAFKKRRAESRALWSQDAPVPLPKPPNPLPAATDAKPAKPPVPAAAAPKPLEAEAKPAKPVVKGAGLV